MTKFLLLILSGAFALVGFALVAIGEFLMLPYRTLVDDALDDGLGDDDMPRMER